MSVLTAGGYPQEPPAMWTAGGYPCTVLVFCVPSVAQLNRQHCFFLTVGHNPFCTSEQNLFKGTVHLALPPACKYTNL